MLHLAANLLGGLACHLDRLFPTTAIRLERLAGRIDPYPFGKTAEGRALIAELRSR